MAKRENSEKRCDSCSGVLERVIFAVTGAATDWHISKANRGVADMFSGRYRTAAHAYACTDCGRITFYAANLEELLEAEV